MKKIGKTGSSGLTNRKFRFFSEGIAAGQFEANFDASKVEMEKKTQKMMKMDEMKQIIKKGDEDRR